MDKIKNLRQCFNGQNPKWYQQFQELKMSFFSDDNTLNDLIDNPQYQLKYLKSMNIKHTIASRY
jgi:hypothetical protein